MSKVIVASIAGFGGVAGIGGGVYLFSNNSSKNVASEKLTKETIKSKLQKEKFKILGSDSQSWGEVKTQYNSARGTSSKVFSIHNAEVTEKELRKLCEDVLSKEEFDDSLYSKAKRWCIIPIAISDYLKNLNFTPLSTEEANDPDKSHWEKLSGEYGNSNEKITGLNSLSGEAWKTLRDKCRDLGAKKSYEEEFDVNLKSFKKWCVKSNI